MSVLPELLKGLAPALYPSLGEALKQVVAERGWSQGQLLVSANLEAEVAEALAATGLQLRRVDVSADTTLCPEAVKAAAAPEVRAVVVSHRLGRVGALPALREWTRLQGVELWEDASRALGSRYQDQSVGSFGELGWFTEVPGVAEALVLVQGGSGPPCTRDFPELAGALERLHKNGLLYRRLLNPVAAVIPRDVVGQHNSYHGVEILVADRDGLAQYLRSEGVGVTVPPSVEAAFPKAHEQAGRALQLPNSPDLTPDEVRSVCNRVNQYLSGKVAAR